MRPLPPADVRRTVTSLTTGRGPLAAPDISVSAAAASELDRFRFPGRLVSPATHGLPPVIHHCDYSEATLNRTISVLGIFAT